MRYLGVVVDNIKDAYSIIRELKRMRVPFELLSPGGMVPRHVHALIICSSSEFQQKGWRSVIFEGDARATVLQAISLALGKERFDEVVVGVDPGESTGFAIIADGELFEAYTIPGPEVAAELARLLAVYPAFRFLVRIGTGKSLKGDLGFLKTDGRVELELVAETKKGLPPQFNRKGLKKDAKSALTLALSGPRSDLA